MIAASTPQDPTPISTATEIQRRQRRIAITQWLRKTHGWFGLWGATLGLLFGCSGIWLNHRAVLPLPPFAQASQIRSNWQLALPDPAPQDAQALVAWLQKTLELGVAPVSVKVEKAKPVAWAQSGDAAPLVQPEHWTIIFGGPKSQLQAEMWAGNRSVSLRRTDAGLMATLTNMHKGTGMSVGWILLVDTLAGCLILLSLSGLALWTLTNRRRVLGGVIFGMALTTTLALALSRL